VRIRRLVNTEMLEETLEPFNERMNQLMSQFDDLKASLDQLSTDLPAAVDALHGEVSKLEAEVKAGGSPDLSGLKAEVDKLDGIVKPDVPATPPTPPAPPA